MEQKVKIDMTSLSNIDMSIDFLFGKFNTEIVVFGEVLYSEDFTNPKNSPVLDISKCGFSARCNPLAKELIIICNLSKHGKMLSDILSTKPDAVRFVPRFVIDQPTNGDKVKLSTFDAIINNKEIWEAFQS